MSSPDKYERFSPALRIAGVAASGLTQAPVTDLSAVPEPLPLGGPTDRWLVFGRPTWGTPTRLT
jgi:hypothetical protein